MCLCMHIYIWVFICIDIYINIHICIYTLRMMQ